MVAAQIVLAVRVSPVAAVWFVLFLAVVSFTLQRRLRPYDDMNSANFFNQADAVLCNNTLERNLLGLQIVQLCVMLFAETVAT